MHRQIVFHLTFNVVVFVLAEDGCMNNDGNDKADASGTLKRKAVKLIKANLRNIQSHWNKSKV